jgi:hypothetical protein
MEINETLSTREGQYGQYRVVSDISQNIKSIMKDTPNYRAMPSYMRESLDMIANKMARILNGNYYLNDSWHDIGGYAALVVMTNEDLETERDNTDAC